MPSKIYEREQKLPFLNLISLVCNILCRSSLCNFSPINRPHDVFPETNPHNWQETSSSNCKLIKTLAKTKVSHFCLKTPKLREEYWVLQPVIKMLAKG
ncbi:hypothetical protein CDAR_167711 [Caerostris darwini]|uniref:Uncharacterized protein n=1 Tax=Caerostris darwini TaxID=1538125 RepID=A0AAV4M7W9_9ARAC|nr:hypothetical protein CDAR_167711 [Caerostris darwini]